MTTWRGGSEGHDTAVEGHAEALLSFWGEPFMSRSTEVQVPRYILPVQRHSELLVRLTELERQYRMRQEELRGT